VKSIVVLISGQGSNLAALIAASRNEAWPARISAVVCDRAGASGLRVAAEAGIACETLLPSAFASRALYDEALAHIIDKHKADLVLLAGFMRILSDPFVERFTGRLLNIHPSLLPAFAGLDVHRRVLASGAKVHGATVHFVSTELDGGPIVAQAAVAVFPDDDEALLADRVRRAEHQLYPRVVRWFVEDRLHLVNGRAELAGEPEPLCFGLSPIAP
jgi:phosphoribosylglycinamide formyltransferase-1